MLTVPWWLRLVRDLGEERRARIRTEERAEIAAHLHDSVLQTLALIQQQSGSGREVRRLARGQNGSCARGSTPLGYGRAGREPVRGSLSETLAAVAGEVEDTYAVSVEVVVVGDCPADEALAPLVLASREAMVNAARHAGVGRSASTPRSSPPRCTCSSGTGVPASIPARYPRTGTAWRTRSTAGWSGTGAP